MRPGQYLQCVCVWWTNVWALVILCLIQLITINDNITGKWMRFTWCGVPFHCRNHVHCYVFVISSSFPFSISPIIIGIVSYRKKHQTHLKPIIFSLLEWYALYSLFLFSWLLLTERISFYCDYYLKILAVWCVIQAIQLSVRNDCCFLCCMHIDGGGLFHCHLRNNSHFVRLP